jgi:hypothetical protein
MQNPNTSNIISDTLLTAPAGIGSLTAGGLVEAGAFLYSNVTGAELGSIVHAVSIGLVYSGIRSAAKQFDLRHRLESALDANGYDDRIMIPATRRWCSRQTGRVVCKNAGYLAEYQDLCRRVQEPQDS